MHRSRCFWCGQKLTDEEWIYGACFDCIDKKAAERGWKPGGHPNNDKGDWKKAENCPRWHEYGDYHEMDEEGIILLLKAAYGGRKVYASSAETGRRREVLPEGMRKCVCCRKLIPVNGRERCDECSRRFNLRAQLLKEQRKALGECTKCGAVLPKGWKFRSCEACLEKSRKHYREVYVKRLGGANA